MHPEQKSYQLKVELMFNDVVFSVFGQWESAFAPTLRETITSEDWNAAGIQRLAKRQGAHIYTETISSDAMSTEGSHTSLTPLLNHI